MRTADIPIRQDPGHAPQEQGEDRGRQERLEDRPRRTEDRLFVAYLHVSPHQEEKELAVFPKVAEWLRTPASCRLDDSDGEFRLS